jgi:pilus assembly protein Flp/PilA
MVAYLALLTDLYFQRLGISQEKGQGLVEYALIILLIAIVVIGAVTLFGQQLNTLFQNFSDTFAGLMPNS